MTDLTFLPLLEKLADRLVSIERYVVLTDAAHLPATSLRNAVAYEEWIGEVDEDFAWRSFDENTAAGMCYTSGTTGNPKGVVYSHRSNVLHAMATCWPDMFAISSRDVVMPVVPMFHANAWGLPYAATLAGARQVLPGPRMAPADLAALIVGEGVTRAAGVPTIWQGMLALEDLDSLAPLQEILCGGSAVPEALIRAFDERFGVPIVQAWGMTETSPIASIARVPNAAAAAGEDERYRLRAMQGRVVPLVDFRVDEEAGGELQVHGPWIARDYYNDETSREKFTPDGEWLKTGDVAEVQDGAVIKLVDRTKDLVKSGGEWISSVELENEIMAHPDVLEAAVVAVPDERWGERPCACVVAREGKQLDADGVRAFLEGRVAKWWLPERVEVIDEVPKTSVGKFDKKVLRARLAEERPEG
jgi:fatty-acyl-CoA synthase